jgi:hypothetical protein
MSPTHASTPLHSISHTSSAQSFAQIGGQSPPGGTGSGSHSAGVVVDELPESLLLPVGSGPVPVPIVVPVSSPLAVPVSVLVVAVDVDPLADADPVGEPVALIDADPLVGAPSVVLDAPSVPLSPSVGSAHADTTQAQANNRFIPTSLADGRMQR